MGALVIVVVGLAVFLWLFSRSVRAGHGKLLLYIVWIVGGICVVIALPPEMRPAAQVFAWVWMAGLFGLPAWWVYHASHRRRTQGGDSVRRTSIVTTTEGGGSIPPSRSNDGGK